MSGYLFQYLRGMGTPVGLCLGLGIVIGFSFCDRLVAQSRLPSVDPGGTEERFDPVTARFIRMTISATNGGEPAVDEIEVFGPGDRLINLAQRGQGTVASASSEFSGRSVDRHAIEFVNDGDFGNASAWVAGTVEEWVQLEFSQPREISRIVWSRDRHRLEITRTPTRYRFEVSLDGEKWREVANSEARFPFNQHWAGKSIEVAGFSVPGKVEDWSFGSPYLIDKWHTIDGLPSESVVAIEQTPDGYLWLGGEFGLARFDGRRFRMFQPQVPFDGALGGVVELLVTSSGELWLSSASGRVGVIEGNRFLEKESAGGVIHQLAEGADGSVWGASDAGLCSMRKESPRVSIMDDGEAAQIVVGDREGAVYYGRYGAIRRRQRGPARVLMESGTGRFFSSAALATRSAGGVWIYDREGQLRHSLSNDLITAPMALPFSIALEKEYDLLEDTEGNIWFAVNDQGVFRLDPNGRCERFPLSGVLPGSGGAAVLFEDRSGAIWAGGRDRGLFRFRRREVELIRLSAKLASVVSVFSGDGDSVLALDRRGDGFRVEGRDVSSVGLPASRILVPGLAPNRFWISPRTWENETIHVWEGAGGGKLQKIAEWAVPGQWITSAVRSSSGKLVFGLMGNLGVYENGQFGFALESKVESVGRVRRIVAGVKDHYWLVSEGGTLWEFRDQTFTKLAVPTEVGSTPVGPLYSEDGRTLWVGTLGRGLWRMDETGWTSINRELGFPAQFVRALVGDNAGNLWAAGHGGFYRIHVGTHHSDPGQPGPVLGWAFFGGNFGGGEVQVSLEGYPNACQGGDGRLFFATNLGLAVLDPVNLSNQNLAPTLVIEDLRLNGKSIDFEPDFELSVDAHSDFIELEFAVPNVASPESMRVQYRLLGRDERWKDLGAERLIRISGLAKGRYEVQLRAAAGQSLWNHYSGEMSVRALAPFWDASRIGGAFLIGGLLLMSLGGVFIFVRSLQGKLKLAENLQSVDQERARIAADMHDRLGSGLTHLSLMVQELDEHPSEELRARVRSSVYDSARSLDEIVWAIDPSKDTVESFIAYCMNLVDEFRDSSTVRWHIETPEETDGIPVRAAVRHELFLALGEAMTNVIKHANAEKAWLRIWLEARGLVVEVQDDGQGFRVGKRDGRFARGNGLKSLRSRLARIGGECEILSNEGSGTLVRFVVPGVFSGA